ncbi:MAG: thiolase family protein [Clostridiales Family XIII bacterium]|jgi:acetyl-CoA C-acetyltransferase|nr:thiolase family protein [Clostridiales Family XIII bacterium]
MSSAYILGGYRTYIGKKGRAFRGVPAEDLAAAVIGRIGREFLFGNDGSGPHTPDLVIAGNAVGGGGNIARLAALKADPVCQAPGLTVDLQCASGLAAVMTASALIRAREADLVIAGGMESASTQPQRLRNKNHPLYDPEKPGYTAAVFSPDDAGDLVMLEGAERTAGKMGASLEELNDFCLASHAKAAAARDGGLLRGIIEPAFGSVRDEEIREKMSPELLARMKPVLESGRFIHPANAASEADGAAFVLVCSGWFLEKSGLVPVAEILASAYTEADPNYSPMTALPTLEKVAEAASLNVHELDAVELNEPFAVISAMFARAYPDLVPVYNRFGGSLAYGHPFGASGAVILLHLLESLRISDGTYGVCAVPAAGGVGAGLAVRRIRSCEE